jgi:hypothetical protein
LIDLLARRLSTAETNIEALQESVGNLSNVSQGDDGTPLPPGNQDTPVVPDDPDLPGVSTNWNLVIKDTTETRTSGLVTDDQELQFPVLPNRTYTFRLVVTVQSGLFVTFQCGVNGPAAPATLQYRIDAADDSASVTNLVSNIYNDFILLPGGTELAVIRIDGMVINGAAGGVVAFIWGGSGSCVVNRGSYLEYMVLTEEAGLPT